MSDRPPPLTRRDLQALTRERLIVAAREVFSRDGYHGARLDLIAREAGFSKGAVYSNFSNKAELFLAVMDENIALAANKLGGDCVDEEELTGDMDPVEAVRGFALATLEFIATAARDEVLSHESGKRVALLVQGYQRVIEETGARREGMSSEQLAGLLTALDQGAAVLSLAGSDVVSDEVLQGGIAALLGVEPDTQVGENPYQVVKFQQGARGAEPSGQ